MPKKQKRSPYVDAGDAVALFVKPPKQLRGIGGRQSLHTKPTKATTNAVSLQPDSNNLSSPPSTQQRMSIEELEQKKMLLPYLDKIEYINVQLRQRGLLPEESTSSETTPYFQAQAPPVALDAKPKKQAHSKGAQETVTAATSAINPKSTVTRLTRQRSERQLQEADGQRVKRMKIANEKLRLRYPRLFASIDSARVASVTPRERPINWLLRMIEDVYDGLTDFFILGKTARETSLADQNPQLAEDRSPRPEDGESARTGSSPETGPRLFQTRLVMPYLVRKHIDQVLGLEQLADQECLDLMYNLEAAKEKFAPAALFSMFLREIYDDDTLLFYLFVRHLVQREFELQLRAKTKLAHTTKTGKKFIDGGKVHLTNHPLIPDGSQAVYLTQEACEQVWRQFFTCCEQTRPKRGDPINHRTVTSALSHYLVAEQMTPLFDSQNVVSLDQVFKWCIELFRTIPEDIIAQYKYQDDGESLRSLLRLRDTISSDLKIEKLTVSYSERERCLRNMKIELLRLERSNNEDNKNRTQIRLLKNQIGLSEQQLLHIQSQILTAETLMDGVWQEVVASSPTRGKTMPAVKIEFSKGSKELLSVLGRFEAYIGRLQRRYDIEVKAAAKLKKPWRKQLEELQLRMVMKIQRAYRARKRARETKKKAREELQQQIRQRETIKQHEHMERKRQEAVLEKDFQRHQARMIARREQEEATRSAIQQKQEELVRKMRQERLNQLDFERNVRVLRRLFALWTNFLTSRRKRRNANRLFLKFQFMKWRHHLAAHKAIERCAVVIQRAYKRWRERLILRKSVQLKRKRANLARRYLQKVQQRHLHRVFGKWNQWTGEQLQLKANFRAIIQRRMDEWFSRWCGYVQSLKRDRLHAVLLVQRVYRGRLARQVYRAQQLQQRNAITIQRVYRGHRGRRITSNHRQMRKYQEVHSLAILKRIHDRMLLSCFDALHLHKDRQSHIKFMHMRRLRRILRATYYNFVEYRNHKRSKRAAFLRHQYECAVLIQRNYRRHRCQVVVRASLQYHRAAIQIQRVFRGYRDHKCVCKLRRETAAARKVQAIWRQRQALKLAEKTRTKGILLAAYKGDFTATKRAIEAGHVNAVDEEWNGILHMAAAAGHKRIVKLCLRSHVDINTSNSHGQTPLHLLLSNLPPPSSIYEQDEETKRVVRDRVDLAAYMIDHGAWHEAADEHGLTPLLLCAALGQVEAAEMLLERGASGDARSSTGLNAAQLAVEGNHSQALQTLAEFGGLHTPANTHDTLHLLHTSAGRGLVDCLKVLVDHLAASVISRDQWDRRDNDGYTPLIYAISNGHTEAVQLLLEKGANPDEKDFFGRSPIHFAVCVGEDGSPDIVQLLTTYDVDVNVKDNDGDAALHISCDRDTRRDCTSLLLRHGAFIGANALGNHPTHIAARHGAVETLKLLVEYGADMNIKNYDGKTPLGMARMLNQNGVIQFIKQYFATEPVGENNQVEYFKSEGEEAITTEDDKDELRPARTVEEWQTALTRAFRMGTLAEWTHYVDTETEVSFFVCASENNSSDWHCTWDSPIEFDAALGDAWEVVRGGPSGVALRSRSPPQAPSVVDQDESPHERGGHGVQYFYHNKVTGEVRSTVPPIDYGLLQDVVQNSKRHQRLRQKIRKVSADSSASAMEYMRFFHDFEAESAQTKAELFAAIKIQRHFRALRTKRMVRLLLFENKCAVELQRAFRGRQARKLATFRRYEHSCATKIQAHWRGFIVRKMEREGLRAERVLHLHRRRSVIRIQRLFRGHQARLLAYREKVVHQLGPRGYFAWEQARRRAVVRQSYRIWDEMELPYEFPGVCFYCHQITRSCSWEKPKEWQAHDVEHFKERCQMFRWGYTHKMKLAAIRLQASWRARQARISFRLIMKSVHMMKASEREYLEDPANLVKMGNYVLYLHAILHDYDRARPLYGRLMRTMAQRGPDVPFILFSYAIFLYVTQEDDVALVEDMILRGKLLDRQLIKYKMAFLGFFRQSMLQNPHDGESNLNYAACLQWLFEQYDEAGTYYIRAIAANPHKKGSMELYQDMLNRKRQIDKAANPAHFAKPTGKNTRRPQEEDELRAKYDSYEQFRLWQVKQAEEDDIRRRREYEAELDARNRLDAARKIQARFRRRRAMRIVNRVKGERRMVVSMVDLADTKAVYDRVRLAFEKLAPPTSSSSATSPLATRIKFTKSSAAAAEKHNKPTSMPMSRLEELFGAMDLSLTPADMQTALADFRSQFGKMPNVNVMDLTNFAQTHPIVSSKVKIKSSKP